MIVMIVLFLSYGIAFYLALMAVKDRTIGLGRFLGMIAGLTLLPLVFNLVVMAVIGPNEGCDGFTHNQWDCSRWDALAQQPDFSTFLFVMFNVLWIGLLGLMCLTNLTLRYLDTRRA